MVGPQDPTRSALPETRAAPPPPKEAPPPEIPGFKLLSKLGQGGQGEVWLAEAQDGLGKRCAIKVFPREATASYERELEAWRRVEEIRRRTGTPHLVEGYAAGTSPGGVAFVAMAFFERGSLAERLAQDGPFPSPLAVRYARHVLAAVELLHRHGIFHRDVKPQNVLVGTDGIARLADYGLSKRLDASVTGSCTPAFAAPEQLAGDKDADGVKIDIYAVAATLFALLTGKPPVPGRPDVFLLERLKVPRALHGPLLRALDPDPAKRPRSAGDFAHDLARAEPSSSGFAIDATYGSAAPSDERPLPSELAAPTRAAGEIESSKPVGPDADTKFQTTEGRRARRARRLVGLAAGLAVIAIALDAAATKDRSGRPWAAWIGTAAVPTEKTPVKPEPKPEGPPQAPLRPGPVRLEEVRSFAAAPGAIAFASSGSVLVVRGGEVRAFPGSLRRASPWRREGVIGADRRGRLVAIAMRRSPEGEVQSQRTVIEAPGTGRVNAFAAHPASGRVAYARTSGPPHVLALDGDDRIEASWRLPEPLGLVTGLAIDDAGSRLAVASISADGAGRVAVYSLAGTPELATAIDHAGPTAVAWVEGELLAIGDVHGELSIVRTRDGAHTRTIALLAGSIVALAPSPSGALLLALGDDRRLETKVQPGSVVLESGSGSLSFSRHPRPRAIGFRMVDLAARGEPRPVLDGSVLDAASLP